MKFKLYQPIISAVIVIAIASMMVCMADPVDTYQSGWNLIRATANEDGATFAATYNLAANEGSFASKGASAFHIVGRDASKNYGIKVAKGSRWAFVISGSNYNNVDDTFSFNLVGWASGNGMLQNIIEGNGVLGTQAVVTYPDGDDALGALFSVTDANYTHSTTTFVDSTDSGSFSGAVAGMLAYVSGTNLTTGYYQITTVTDANTLVMSGMTSTDNNTDSAIKSNPAFWADTIAIDETTKWPRDADANNVMVYNSGDNEVAMIVVEVGSLEWLQWVFYDCDGATGEEAGNVTVYGRRL